METMLLLARSAPWEGEKSGNDLVGGSCVNQPDDLSWSLAVMCRGIGRRGGLALSKDSSSTTLRTASPTKLRDFASVQLLWSHISALGIFINNQSPLLK